jgi:hypothetical protein
MLNIARITALALLATATTMAPAQSPPPETAKFALLMGTGGCFFGRVSLRSKPSREVLIQDHLFCTKFTQEQAMFGRLSSADQASVLNTLEGQRELLVERELKDRK